MYSRPQRVEETFEMQLKLSCIDSYFPSIVRNAPSIDPALRKIFGYQAESYDLAAYEKVTPGHGRRIWDMITKEHTFQAEMRAAQASRPKQNWFLSFWRHP